MKMRNATRIKSLFHFCLALVAACFFCSCSNDEKPANVNPDDPTAVTQFIEVPNSILETGTLPDSTNDVDAPIIEDATSDLITVPGGELVIAVYPEAGDIKGFYLKVNGASQYFDIKPINPAIGGRLMGRMSVVGRKNVDIPYFIIRLPENVMPGTFCITYAAYDNAKRVSNWVTRCIVIKEAGGDFSFLTSSVWSAVYTKEVSPTQGTESVEFMGETYTQSYAVGIDCDGIPTNVTADIQTRINFIYLSLFPSGEFEIQKSFYSKEVDAPNSNCTPTYKESTSTTETAGSWVYESDSEKLLLVLNASEAGSIIYEYTVTESSTTSLILREDLGNGDYSETEYEPKN